jgi:hypothetical protein
MFKPAKREKGRLRMTIDGPAGAGKTYTALRLAYMLGRKVAVIDTEQGSASKYVGEAPDGIPWLFDVVELTTFSPEKYTEMVQLAGKMGYDVLVIDSLSHAGEGVGGALDIKDRVGISWTAWRQVTPLHNRMIDAILQSPCHIITTMRSRIEYVQELDGSGKVTIRRVGMAPVQRPGIEYEFDIVLDMDYAHIATVGKTRCPAITDLKVEKPGPGFMVPILAWLNSINVIQNGQDNAPSSFPVTLADLVARFGAEAVLAACEGHIPNTSEELGAIAQKLGWERVIGSDMLSHTARMD